jgi:hypothetical protein
MDDLITFVNARLDEDDAALLDDDGDEPGELRFGEMDDRTARYTWTFANNDRVKREIAAKREILRRATFGGTLPRIAPEPTLAVQVLDGVVAVMAQVWSDHPDYQQGWAP